MTNVMDMVNMLEKGEEPIMLKICMGTATGEEIKDWATEQGIPEDNIGDAIKELQESFVEGSKMAETVENNDTCETNMNDKMDIILSQIGIMMKEIHDIKTIISNKSFKDNDNL